MFDLIIPMRDTFTNSNLGLLIKLRRRRRSRTNEFKDVLSWNISQMITMTIPINTRIIKKQAKKGSIPLEFNGEPMETENKMT